MSSMLSVVLKDLWHKDQNAWGCSQVRLSVFCPVIEERISSLTKVYCLLRPFFFFCFFFVFFCSFCSFLFFLFVVSFTPLYFFTTSLIKKQELMALVSCFVFRRPTGPRLDSPLR